MSDPRVLPFRLEALRVPRAVLAKQVGFQYDVDGFALADISVDEHGVVASLRPSDAALPGPWIVFPALIEPHTHIDKAFTRARAPNPTQSFEGARQAIDLDRAKFFSDEDAHTRMRRALGLAYSHGVVALRTHLDSQPDRLQPCWEVFARLRKEWAGKLHLQAVVSLGSAKLQGDHGEVLGRLAAEYGALIGPVFYFDEELGANVERAFALGERYGVDLDVHVDENNWGHANGMRAILDHLERKPFGGRLNLSHLCNLRRCSPEEIQVLAARAAALGVSVISLPVANLHLQERDAVHTPQWRGLTPINALLAAGVEVALGGDNSQDMFVPWGALDPLVILREAILAAHISAPLGDAVRMVSGAAANILRLHDTTPIHVGQLADFTLFKSHDPYGALSGDFEERLTLRRGKVVGSRVFTWPDHDFAGSGEPQSNRIKPV